MNFLRRIPTELWALLLLALPVAFMAMQRLDMLSTAPGLIKGPNDPDPWLRLTLVREWLMGGSWFDHTVPRTNAPLGGITSPWTRPLDMVIAALVKLQPGHASLDLKLLRAATILPLLWMTLLLPALFRITRSLTSEPIAPILAAVFVATTPVLWAYFGRGNADHHALLAMLWVWAISCSLRRESIAQGLLLALMLWISPEALLPIALLYCWQAFGWLFAHESIARLQRLTLATALATSLFVLIERGTAWPIPIYDSLSIVHSTLLLLCTAAAFALAAFPLDTLRARLITSAIVAIILGVTIHAFYPKFFHGPMVDASPFIFTDFLPRINEAKPLFTKPPLFVAALLLVPILALIGSALLLRIKNPSLPRAHTAQMLWLLLGTIALISTQLRWYYYVMPVSAALLASILAPLFTPANTWPGRLLKPYSEHKQTLIRLGAVIPMIILPWVFFTTNPDTSAEFSKRMTACERQARSLIHNGTVNRLLGPTPRTLYAPTNLGAELLFYTPHSIVASNYHREAEGIAYVWNTTRLETERDLKNHFLHRNITAAIVCPDGRMTKNSELKRWINGGKLPAWATPILPAGKYTPLLVVLNPR